MLVEHQFVTTLDAALAFELLDTAMRSIDMRAEPTVASLERRFKNSKPRRLRPKHIHDLPLSIGVNFDRGRVTVAATVDEISKFRKAKPQLQEMLISLCGGVEQALVARQPHTEAFANWVNNRRSAIAGYRQKQIRDLRLAGVMVFVAIAIVVVSLVFALRQRPD